MVSSLWQLVCCSGVPKADCTAGPTGGGPAPLDTGESVITPAGISQDVLSSTTFDDRSPFKDTFGRGRDKSIDATARSLASFSAEFAPAAQALPQAGPTTGSSAPGLERRSLRQREAHAARLFALARQDESVGSSYKIANRRSGQATASLFNVRSPSEDVVPSGGGFAVQALRTPDSAQLSASLSEPFASSSSPDSELLRLGGSPASLVVAAAAAVNAAHTPAPAVPSRLTPAGTSRNANTPATATRFAAAGAATAAAAEAAMAEAPPAEAVAAVGSAARVTPSGAPDGVVRMGVGLGSGSINSSGTGAQKHPLSPVSLLSDAWVPHLRHGPQEALPAAGERVQPASAKGQEQQQQQQQQQPQTQHQQQTQAQMQGVQASASTVGVAVRHPLPHYQRQPSRLAAVAPAAPAEGAVQPQPACGAAARGAGSPGGATARALGEAVGGFSTCTDKTIKQQQAQAQQQAKGRRGSSTLSQMVFAASAGRLSRVARPDASQVALLQMLHFGSLSGRVPLHHLASLNVTCLSREIRALHWIGQGGGGAVFQGVWQGAPVAVKFMVAAQPEHVDATAMEAIVSVAVGHPNVVTTYCFDVTRLTDKSFTDIEQHTAAAMNVPLYNGEENSATALYNALMESNTSLEPSINHQMRSRQCGGAPGACVARAVMTGGSALTATANALTAAGNALTATGNGAAGPGGPPCASSRSAVCRADSLGMRVRRAQAAAATVSSAVAAATPTAGEQEGIVCGGASGSDSSGGSAWAPQAPSPPQQEAPPPQQPQRQQQPQQHQQHQVVAERPHSQQQHATGAAGQAPYDVGRCLESMFNSEDGFGEPDLAANVQAWTVRHVLSYLKARPGMYMTHIIMEYCDRGSLQSAIQRGIFRMDTLHDEVNASGAVNAVFSVAFASAGGSSKSASASAVGSRPGSIANVGGSAAAADTPCFTRRVVLRALLRTARDVAQGMSHLHANNIIHGDLKPGNVLLRGCRTDRRGFTALVSDFGLSKITRGDKPLELNHWSTVTVMAPEVIMGRWLKASDVFSFGILLWQLVMGEMMPYGNLTVQQVLLGVSQGVLKPAWPSWAHTAVVRLGQACLATSPEKRPSFEAIVKILTKIEQNVRTSCGERTSGRVAATTGATATRGAAAVTGSVAAAAAAASRPS